MARHFDTSRLLRKREEWLRKPLVTSLQFAQMSEPLQKEVRYWMEQNGWRFSANHDAILNPDCEQSWSY